MSNKNNTRLIDLFSKQALWCQKKSLAYKAVNPDDRAVLAFGMKSDAYQDCAVSLAREYGLAKHIEFDRPLNVLRQILKARAA